MVTRSLPGTSPECRACPQDNLETLEGVTGPRPVVSKRIFWPAHLPIVFRHVSGGLRGPFWDPFWPAKMLVFGNRCWSRGSSFWNCFSFVFCYACTLKFDCFGRCGKKAHMAFDPQKLMDFQHFCICAAPPATQQGRQKRTTHSIEKRTQTNIKTFETISFLDSRPGRPIMPPKYLQK